MSRKAVVVVNGRPISLERIAAVATGEAAVKVSTDTPFVKQMERAQELVMAAVQNDVPVYGVNTGFGKSCGKRIPVKTASSWLIHKRIVDFLTNHGFKAISITATALCAEALKATMPAASFSRSCKSAR